MIIRIKTENFLRHDEKKNTKIHARFHLRHRPFVAKYFNVGHCVTNDRWCDRKIGITCNSKRRRHGKDWMRHVTHVQSNIRLRSLLMLSIGIHIQYTHGKYSRAPPLIDSESLLNFMDTVHYCKSNKVAPL